MKRCGETAPGMNKDEDENFATRLSEASKVASLLSEAFEIRGF
jgi:hypothetical protein